MEYYFAPLEGITGYIYRQAHHASYPGLDRYYTPFIVPKEKKLLSTKERRDVLPEHNAGMAVIPQILTNRPEEFLRIAGVLFKEYGYQEINLNLGCPSKTVVSKKRGAGFLADPDGLERFLETVCSGLEPYGIKLSVKTRIGKDSPDEFFHLLEIFARFPLSELIVHPRVQADFYGNVPNREAFAQAYAASAGAKWQLCYNGDIFQWQDYKAICTGFPNLPAIMMGRGLLVNPMLAEELKVRENCGRKNKDGETAIFQRFSDAQEEKAERKRRYGFYQRLLEDYKAVLPGEKHVLFKMKELWLYMSQDFTNPKRYWKKMKKAQKLADFEAAANQLCAGQRLRENVPDFG